jgi:hypothetical protein
MSNHLLEGAPAVRIPGYAEGAMAFRAARRGILPSDFAITALHRDGKPYDMYRRKHLPRIYNEPGDMLLKCSRQTEKSTTLSNLLGMFLYGGQVVEPDGIPRPIRALYFTASGLQASDFSKDRLARVLESPCFTESCAGGLPLWPKDRNTRSRNYVDQIGEKMLRNLATIKLRACYQNADRVRGISTDVIAGDEIQDVLSDLMPVIEESAARSPLRKRIYCGTPKTFDNNIEQRWQESTMAEWMVRCESCRKHQHLTEKNIGLKWNKDIESGCICAYCGRIMDPQNGQWVMMGDPESQLKGYRFCHVMLPQDEKSWLDILEKRKNYPEQQFFNEVLGFSHEHANQVITKAQLMACCDNTRRNGAWPASWTNVQGLAAGVDWGGPGISQTVLTIGGYVDDKFRILFQKNYGRFPGGVNDVLDDIARICVTWGIRVCGTDFSVGAKENQDLAARMYPNTLVIPFQNHGTQRETAKWDPRGRCYIISRTKTLANLFNLIAMQNIEFFCEDDMKEFVDGYTYTFAEFHSKSRVLIYDHPPNKPDDELHSMNYCYLASTGQFGKFGIKVDQDHHIAP